MVCIQEPFIEQRAIQHNSFNLHWLGGERKDARVLTAIKKDLVNRVVIKKRSDLVNHPYVMTLDIKDLDQKTRLPSKRIRVVNVYDQVIGREYTYLGAYARRRRAIEDVS